MRQWSKKTALPVMLAGVLCLMNNSTASSEEQDKEVSELCKQVQKLITEYYPKSSFETKDGNFVAKYNTRTFMIHHALKTGEWQEARPQEGPNRKGIRCSISSADGHWGGAAMVPQTFEYHYFSSLLMAPYNKRLNKHLISHLEYPDDASAQFRTSYQKLVSSFSER